MILEFRTKVNRNGNLLYLAIDTTNNKFTTRCPHIIAGGVKVTPTAIKEIKRDLIDGGFVEVDRIY